MSDSKEYEQGWNAAVRAAEAAIVRSPVFPKDDYGGPAGDAERIRVLEIARKQVAALSRF